MINSIFRPVLEILQVKIDFVGNSSLSRWKETKLLAMFSSKDYSDYLLYEYQ